MYIRTYVYARPSNHPSIHPHMYMPYALTQGNDFVTRIRSWASQIPTHHQTERLLINWFSNWDRQSDKSSGWLMKISRISYLQWYMNKSQWYSQDQSHQVQSHSFITITRNMAYGYERKNKTIFVVNYQINNGSIYIYIIMYLCVLHIIKMRCRWYI